MNADDPRVVFGTMLRDARVAAGITQAQLADIMGTTQAFVSSTERGETNPPLLTCIEFARAVRCQADTGIFVNAIFRHSA